MVTDKWPDEEGYIVEGTVIGFATLGGTVLEGEPVKFGTAATGQVVVTTPAAVGDSFGVALKYGVSGDIIPVAVGGVMKFVATGTFNVGEYVMGGTSAWVQIGGATANTTKLQIFTAAGSAGSYVLGLALQTAGASGDEVLVMLTGGL